MIYFISDIHLAHSCGLGLEKKEQNIQKENLLISFLKKIEVDSPTVVGCHRLFIVGDLFDYWFEYGSVIPKVYIRTLAELYRLRQNGVQIEYLMGNHDFGHIDFFESYLDIPIYKSDIERTYNGKKFFISHGDGKAHNDTGYRILKKILRNPVSLRLYQLLHPDFGIWLASSSSQKSREHVTARKWDKSDGLKDYAKLKIAEGFDFVIMGHRHKAEFVQFGSGYYINLGDWFDNPTYAVFDGENVKLNSVKSLLNAT